VAQFLLISTLLTIAGLVATSIAGFMATPARAAQHILFALMTVLLGLFSQSMTLFFFIGTGKQLKDKVKDTVHDADVRKATRALTMKVSPVATYAMFVIMITFITGGGVGSGRTPRWLHDVLTVASIVMYARAYWIEIQAMTASADLMEKYLKE
jgi:hypothetical protein